MMSKQRRKYQFPCGHKGRGKECRRCVDAQKLLDKAYEKGSKGKADIFTFKQMRIEAAKLHAVGTLVIADLEWAGFDQDEARRIVRDVVNPPIGEMR
jgi:hypothetical protein